MAKEEWVPFVDCLRPALNLIAGRDARVYEFAGLLERVDDGKRARCLATPQGRAFLRGGIHTPEGRSWLGLDPAGPDGETEIRDCDILRWAFTAELMQLGETVMPSEKALSFVDQGITLRDIRSRPEEELAERRMDLVRELASVDNPDLAQIGALLHEPGLAGTPQDPFSDQESARLEAADLRKWLANAFKGLKKKLERVETAIKRDELTQVLSLTAVEADLLIDQGIDLDEISRRPAEELAEQLFAAEPAQDGKTFSEFVGEAVDLAKRKQKRDAISFADAIKQAVADQVADRQQLKFVAALADRVDEPDRAGQLLRARIKNHWWQKVQAWQAYIESAPGERKTLFPVQFYDILVVSDFHVVAGNQPSPEGIARFSPTEDFFYDNAFFRFLYHCEDQRRQRDGYPYELVFNGDMFDFAQAVVPDTPNPLIPWPLPLPWELVSPGESSETLNRLFKILADVDREKKEEDKILGAVADRLPGFLADVVEREKRKREKIVGQAIDRQVEVLHTAGELTGAPNLAAQQVQSLKGALEAVPKDDTAQWDIDWGVDKAPFDEAVWARAENTERKDWIQRGVKDSEAWSDEDWDDWAYEDSWEEKVQWTYAAWEGHAEKEWAARDLTRPRVLSMDRDRALGQLADIYWGHRRFFQGLAWFLAQGNRLIVMRGNHDPQWYWPEVQLAFVCWLKKAYSELQKACTSPVDSELPVAAQDLRSLPKMTLEDFEARIDFDHSWYYYRDRLAYFEHGGQQEALDAHRYFMLPVYFNAGIDSGGLNGDSLEDKAIIPEKATSWLPSLEVLPREKEIEPPVGSLGQVYFVNNLETQFPNFDRPEYGKVYTAYLKYGNPLLIGPFLVALWRTLKAIAKWAAYPAYLWLKWIRRLFREPKTPQSMEQEELKDRLGSFDRRIEGLLNWRVTLHQQRILAYARLTGLPADCVQKLDRTQWVGWWRTFVAGHLLIALGVIIMVALIVVLVFAIALVAREFLSMTGLGDEFSAREQYPILELIFPVSSEHPILGFFGGLLLAFGLGFIGYRLFNWVRDFIGLGEDYLYKPSQKIATKLEACGQSVPYILFGHDHVRNAQRLKKGPWYLNTGTWMHKDAIERKRLLREPLEYAFVRMVDTHHVLAAGHDDYMASRPETRPKVELLRWNDEGGWVESCETFKGLDELSVTDEYELIRRYEPVLRFSKDGDGQPERYFPMAAEHYVRECGLRREGEGWVYEPGQTPLHRLGRVPDSAQCYLAFAAGDVDDDQVVLKLMDQGLELSRARAEATVYDRGPDEGPQYGDLVLRAVVKQESADRLAKDPGDWGEITRQALDPELSAAEKQRLAGREKQLESVIPSGLATLPEVIHQRAREKYQPYRDWLRFPPVYHYHISKDGRYTVLQYWFLYAFNDWGAHGGLNDHEGDWEVIFVFLDKKDQPRYVAYSRHVKIPMFFEPKTVAWSDVTEPGDTHPRVYVGCGSHASYTEAGEHDIAGLIDYHEGNADSIGPGTSQPWGRPIRLSNRAWNTRFEGHWGALVEGWLGTAFGTKGPTGPAQKGDKWEKPARWANVPDRGLF